MSDVYKIGVVGEESAVKGFLSLGFDVVSVNNAVEASEALENLKNNSCAVVFMTSNFYEKADTDKYRNDPLFTVIPIPAQTGAGDIGIKRLKKFVEKAVGADILFNK